MSNFFLISKYSIKISIGRPKTIIGRAIITAKGKIIIQKLIKGEEVSLEQSGLSKREWNELMEAFGLMDKII